MAEIKSALEKALEKIENLEKASPEELKRLEYTPEGNAIAARYLRGELTDILAEFSKYDDDVRGYLTNGAFETLLRNINLPKDSYTRQASNKAMEGILTLKENKSAVKEIDDQIQHLFTYYEGALQQTLTQLKERFQGKLGEIKKSMEMQLGKKAEVKVEQLPQFQEEWRRAVAGLDMQYEKVLEEHKQRILNIT